MVESVVKETERVEVDEDCDFGRPAPPTPSLHGLHVHRWGNLTAHNCASSAGHFDPDWVSADERLAVEVDAMVESVVKETERVEVDEDCDFGRPAPPTPSLHGLHVHRWGNLTAHNCASSAGHFDPDWVSADERLAVEVDAMVESVVKETERVEVGEDCDFGRPAPPTPSLHGLHVHRWGNLTAHNCASSAGHFDPDWVSADERLAVEVDAMVESVVKETERVEVGEDCDFGRPAPPTPSLHGLHVHRWGNLTAHNCASSAGHFDPDWVSADERLAVEVDAMVESVVKETERVEVGEDCDFGRPAPPTPSLHGLHVHRWGNLTAHNCASSAGHFDPDWVHHGGRTDDVRHVGDLGNIISDHPFYFIDDRISLFGRNSIMGRSVVVHELSDDLGRGQPWRESQFSGNAGARVACAIVGRRDITFHDVIL